MEEINIRIATFNYSNTDKANKPQPIKIISATNFKLKQTAACEMWNLIRLLLLKLGVLIEQNNSLLQICLIKFSILVGRLCASLISNSDLLILDLVIEEFFDTYCQLFPDANIKTKLHFLRHYPEMIQRFGPLVKTLSLRKNFNILREDQQKTFIPLSRFWSLREYGSLSDSVKKEKCVTKIRFFK